MLAASIMTAASPHIILGKVEPSLKIGNDTILGRYYINLNDYPMLKELWGSVRINIPPKYTYGFFAPIIVTRLDYNEYFRDFSCIYTLCPHEGRQVYDFEPKWRQFKCSGHGSIFDADGTYMGGPAAQDITTYEVIWDGGDIIYMDIPAVITGVEDNESSLFYLEQNSPNPCSGITQIPYGIEKDAFVTIHIADVNGRTIALLDEGKKIAGHYSLNFDTSNLPVGLYVCALTVNGKIVTSRNIVVRR
jgi:hypothetical protein